MPGNIHDGELSTDILSTSADALVELLKAKRWNDVSTWIFENAHLHPRQVESSLYRALQNQITNQSKPQAVLIFGEYSHKLMSGADPCITLLALCAQLMVEMTGRIHNDGATRFTCGIGRHQGHQPVIRNPRCSTRHSTPTTPAPSARKMDHINQADE